MKTILTISAIFLFCDVALSQISYKFDSTATVNDCSNIYLQKISKDLQYELIVEINQIDSLPKFKAFDLSKYSKFVIVYINKYPFNNKYITGICDDLRPLTKSTEPDKYISKQGIMLISKWDGKFNISVILSNIALKDQSNREIKLPSEIFDQVIVGWKGG